MLRQQCPYAIDPAGQDIHGEARALRARGAVTTVLLPGGVPAWVVTDQTLVKKLLVDPRISKDAYQHWTAWQKGETAETWPLAIWVSVQNMVTAYGDEHRRLRRLVASAFTARRVEMMRPRIEEITARTLDSIGELPPTRPWDVRENFAQVIQTQVQLDLFGIPEESAEPLRRITDGFFKTEMSLEEAQQNQLDMYTTMAELIDFRRRHPADDVTSALIAARDDVDGARLSEKELIDNLILLFTAGFEPTVNLIGNAVSSLLHHPEQLAHIREGRAGWADAVEETLRVEAPGANLILRYAVEDVAVGDVVIPQGDAIMISYAGAGRDTAVHGTDADRFDVLRPTRRENISFGHGAHYCIGAPLARLEAEIALRELFARFPDLTIAAPDEPLRPIPSFIANGLRELPVLAMARAELAV
ncbi:cytochrome P450 (plasmid) [Streptomyces sp. NBC_01267]|uniref:cytochrome P450 family protein n=1 Tax=unclassified Streptomyces TaxID=2593676 RepID=UPI002E33CD64|nr:cytochrome P450 [Streptomyces sp. NBC_01267]